MFGRAVAITVVGVLLGLIPVGAQVATPESCRDVIGRHTPSGIEFSGHGGTITEPFEIKAGLLLAEVAMTEAGGIQLITAAGDLIGLGSASEAYEAVEAVRVAKPGAYYLVADFYSADGDWTVMIEQPAG